MLLLGHLRYYCVPAAQRPELTLGMHQSACCLCCSGVPVTAMVVMFPRRTTQIQMARTDAIYG